MSLDGCAFRDPETRAGNASQGPEIFQVAGLYRDDVPSRVPAGENMQISGPVGLFLLTNYRKKRPQAAFYQRLKAAENLHSGTVKKLTKIWGFNVIRTRCKHPEYDYL